MTEVYLDLGQSIDRRDVMNLRRRLSALGREDQITIRMEAADAHVADLITAELSQQGFDWQPHGSHSGRDYYLTARRKRT
ncbi:MAG TPA: hypothetical protein GX699_09370 [Firmicutes bacterium]|jgi:hypothetical protein|nr:hypothetical protein [Bacillota bacterium]